MEDQIKELMKKQRDCGKDVLGFFKISIDNLKEDIPIEKLIEDFKKGIEITQYGINIGSDLHFIITLNTDLKINDKDFQDQLEFEFEMELVKKVRFVLKER